MRVAQPRFAFSSSTLVLGCAKRNARRASATLGVMESVARALVIGGVVLVALGLLLYASPSIPFLGKLPGDLRVERPGFRLYIPFTTCVLISLILSAVLWLFSRLR